MKWVKWIVGIISVAAFLLGGLWLLQGTSLVVIEPIACVGECEPLEGPSLPWAFSGLLLMLAAASAFWFAFLRR